MASVARAAGESVTGAASIVDHIPDPNKVDPKRCQPDAASMRVRPAVDFANRLPSKRTSTATACRAGCVEPTTASRSACDLVGA